MRVDPCAESDLADWALLRQALWPHVTAAMHRREVEAMLGQADGPPAFICRALAGDAMGFAEASLRHDHVNGCETSPVAFIEGMFVSPPHRGRGVARALCQAIESWARGQNSSELASDTHVSNLTAQALHKSLGFAETERVVFYRKLLRQGPSAAE